MHTYEVTFRKIGLDHLIKYVVKADDIRAALDKVEYVYSKEDENELSMQDIISIQKQIDNN